MPYVDNRVVEMRFDNQQFESGVQTSLNTLEKLKKSLKFEGATKGFSDLDNAAQKVDFGVIEKACQSLTSKFSLVGTVWDQVVRNMTTSAFGFGKQITNLVKGMSVDQLSEGWTKYGQKTASVQTIINATGKDIDYVNESLERLMWYSDETSFGFTDMTKALQTMTSSGGDLDTLIPMMMGIGNAVAFAGKGAGEFSRVMYNLNQAYGMGYLGTMDYRSLENAGVSSKQLKETLIDVTKELGRGEYTLETFSEALTDKAFNKEVMEKAFGRFAEVTLEAEKLVNEGVFDTASDAYESLRGKYNDLAYSAATAAQEAKSFEEAIDATKDAVSSGWMTTWEYVFGNYQEAKQLWTWLANELWDMFAGGAADRNAMLKAWHEGINETGVEAQRLRKDIDEYGNITFVPDDTQSKITGYQLFVESLHNIWAGIEGIITRAREILATIIPPMTYERLMGITEGFYAFSLGFRSLFEVVEEDVIEPIKETISPTEEAVESLEDLDAMAWKVIRGDYGNGEVRFAKLLEEGYNPELIQNRVNELLNDPTILDLIHGTGLYLSDTVEGVENVAEAVEDVGEAADEANVDKKVRTPFENLLKIASAIGAAIRFVKNVVSSAWTKVFLPVITTIRDFLLGPVLTGLGNIGDWVTKTFAKIESSGAVDKVFSSISDWGAKASDSVRSFYDQVMALPAIQNLKTHASILWKQVKDTGASIWDDLTALFSSEDFGESNFLTELLPSSEELLGAVDWVTSKFDDIFSKVLSWNIPEKIKGAWEALNNWGKSFKGLDTKQVFQKLWADIKKFGGDIWTWITDTWSSIVDWFKEIKWGDIWEGIKSAWGSVKTWITDVWNSIVDWFKGINWSDVWQGIKDALLTLLGLIVAIPFLIVRWFMSIDWSAVWQGMKDTWASVATWFTDIWNSVVDWFEGIDWTELWNGIKASWKTVKDWIFGIWGSIIAWFKKVDWTSIWNGIKDAWKTVATWFTDIWNSVVDWFEGIDWTAIWDGIKNAWASVKNWLKNLWTRITDWFKKIHWSDVWKSIKNWFNRVDWSSIWNGLKTSWNSIKQWFKDIDWSGIWNSIVDWFNDIDWEGVWGKIQGAVISLRDKIRSVLFGNEGTDEDAEDLGGGIDSLKEKFEGISKFVGEAKESIVNFFSELPWGAIKIAAISIAAGLLILGILKVVNSIKSLVKTLKNFNKTTESAPKSSPILNLAIAIGILAGSLWLLSNIPAEDLARSAMYLGGFIIVLGLLAAAGKAIASKGLSKEFVKSSLGIIAMAGAILLIASALWIVSKVNLDGIVPKLVAFIGIIMLMTLASKLMSKSASTMGWQGAIGIGILALDLLLMALVLQKLAKVDVRDILRALIPFSLILLVMFGIASVAKKGGKDAWSTGAAIALMAIGIWILADVIEKLSKLNAKDAWRAVLMVDSMAIVLGAIMILLSKTASGNAVKAGGSILAMAVAIRILAISVAYLGKLPTNVAVQGAIIVGGLMTLMGLFAFLAKGLKGATGGIFAITFVLLAVAGVFHLLNLIEPDRLEVEAKALIGALLALTAMTGVLALIGKFAGFGAVMKGLGALMIVIIAIGAVVALLGGFNKISGFHDFMAGGAGILEMLASLADSFIIFSILAGAMALLGLIPVPAVALGVANLAIVVGGIGAIIAILGGLNKIPGFKEFMEGGGEIFVLVMSLIGEAVGALFGGFAKGLTNGLPEMGQNLSDFGSNIEPFLTLLEGVNEDTASGASALADVIKAAASAEVKATIAGWFTNGDPVQAFADDLDILGPALSSYSTAISGFDAEAVTASANAGMALANLKKHLPRNRKFLDKIVGEKSMNEFAVDIIVLGTALSKYSESISDVNPDDVEASANAAKAILNLKTHLPRSGNFIDKFLGEKSMTDFSTEIIKFGGALKSYGSSVSGVDPQSIEDSANAAKALVALKDSLPSSGGFIDDFLGEKSLSDFASDVRLFGLSLKSYGRSIANVDAKSVEGSANAAQALVKLNDSLPASGGALQAFLGEKDFDTFSTNLITFGGALSSYSDSISEVSPYKLERSATAAEALIALQDSLTKSGWYTGIIGQKDISAFGEKLRDFGMYLLGYFRFVELIDFTQLSSVITSMTEFTDLATGLEELDTAGVENFGEAMGVLADSGINSFIDEFTNASDSLTLAGETMVTYVVEAIVASENTVKAEGATITARFAAGIYSRKGSVSLAARMLAIAGETTIRGYYDKWKAASGYLITALITGLNEKKPQLLREIQQLADKSLQTLKNGLQLNYRNNGGEEAGKELANGFINGVDDMSNAVTSSTKNLSNTALAYMQTAVDQINEMINNGLELNPTIRPVVDFSGIDQYGSALGVKNSFSTGFDVSNIRSPGYSTEDRETTRSQMQTVVNAIHSMQEEIHNLSETVEGIQMVTDTGALVGSISRKMDKSLGRVKASRKRGV